MPTDVKSADELKPSDVYEDTFYHPCLSFAVENLERQECRWLTERTHAQAADIGVSDVRKLTLDEEWHWRRKGPRDVEAPTTWIATLGL